jgi:hypothetical protein
LSLLNKLALALLKMKYDLNNIIFIGACGLNILLEGSKYYGRLETVCLENSGQGGKEFDDSDDTLVS